MSNITSAQTQHSMFLNKIGEIYLEVGYDVKVSGDYAYVTNNEGVIIVDVTNPSRPSKISEIVTDEAPFSVEVSDNKCCVSFASGELQIYNVSDANNPQSIASSTPVSGIATGIEVRDSYIFVSYREFGFRIFNLSNSGLDLLYSYSDPRGESIAIKQDMLYYGNTNEGIKVFNISTITSPSYIRTTTSGINVWDMYIHQEILYLGCHGAGIRIYSLNNPVNPSLLRNLNEDDGGEAQGVVANSTHLFVADNWGVEAYDMSTPSLPVEVAEVTNGIGAAHDLDMDDQYIYVALGGGLDIFELSLTQSIYVPRIFYYVIPIGAIVLGIGIFFVIRSLKRKKLKKS